MNQLPREASVMETPEHHRMMEGHALTKDVSFILRITHMIVRVIKATCSGEGSEGSANPSLLIRDRTLYMRSKYAPNQIDAVVVANGQKLLFGHHYKMCGDEYEVSCMNLFSAMEKVSGESGLIVKFDDHRKIHWELTAVLSREDEASALAG